MIDDLNSAQRRLRQGLARIRRRWFVSVWAGVAMRWSLVTLTALAVATAIGMATRPTGPWLVSLAVAPALAALLALMAFAWRWRRRPADRAVARYAEERVPELEERLISAMDVLERADPAATPVASRMVLDAARHFDAVDVNRILPASRLWRDGLVAGAALAAVGTAVWWASPWASRAWQVARATWWPATVALVVEPGDTAVVEGGQVALRVRLTGIDLEAWEAPVVVHATAPHLQDAVVLDRGPEDFVGQLPAGNATFAYRVVSGRLASPEYAVEVRRRPRVERLEISYDYPKFTGLGPRTVEDGGDVFAPSGTRVTVRVHTRDPIASGRLALSSQGTVPLEARADRVLEGRFTVSGDDSYRVWLRDRHGLEGESEVEYFVRAMEDRPADVRILRPGGDARVTRLQEVVIEARADDDFGVARFELVYAPRGEQERVVPLAAPGGTSVTGQHTIYLEDLDVQPGDFVTYYARARDVARGKRSSETRSDIFFLEVRPFNEEFEAAQSQAGQGGSGGSFDDLARLQKDIIVATWRLERRSAAGTSARDVQAIAKAQADVRARTEQLAQRMAPRAVPMPRPQVPPPPAPDPSRQAPAIESPLRRAAAAMARAQEALEAMEVGRALPHENEALNEILRAQAENRRQQVARQSGRAGGGGGRSGNQDLSALFDRELQRQQQTTYEQRAGAQERRQETSPEDEALRRLRELAARQDELARQQQELARRRAQLTPEELARRLQRLTRDQEALRREAESLAAQMQRQAGGGRPREPERSSDGEREGSSESSAQGSAEQAQRVREAAAEMAAAAGALRGESVDSASARSDRAADRLRAAERALAAAQPDERRRRAGDLQLEARQLADAQRRLAADALAGAVDPDRWRRMAGRQAQLAERARELEQAARDLAGHAAAGPSGDPARQAARELAVGRVAERMAANAAAAAGRSSQPDEAAARQLAETARSLAPPLDRAADLFARAGGVDAEARRLSDGLAQTRRLREQIDEIEGRAAQGRDRSASALEAPRPGSDRSGSARPGERGQQSDGTTGGGQGRGADFGQLREEVLRELRQRRELVDAIRRESPELGQAITSLEGWVPSNSAPGTEPWKQDFARWDQLKRRLAVALATYDASVSSRLAAREARGRVDAGGDERPPDQWRDEVADYFEMIARKPPR